MSGVSGWVGPVGRFIGEVVRSLRGRDLPLHAAAVTFYGGIAVVPAVVLSIRFAALLAGTERIEQLTAAPVDAVPGCWAPTGPCARRSAAGWRSPWRRSSRH